MLTFEQSKNVKPLCKIIGGKYNNKVISIDPNITEADYVTTFKKLEIGNSSNLQMFQIPLKRGQSGMLPVRRGAGKVIL